MPPTELPAVHARHGEERRGGRLEPYQLDAFRRGEYNDYLMPSFRLISSLLRIVIAFQMGTVESPQRQGTKLWSISIVVAEILG